MTALYHDDSTGKYKGTVKSAQQGTQKPDTDNAVGLECGPSIAGTSGTTNILQSGGDPGRINEINPTTRLLVKQFTSLIGVTGTCAFEVSASDGHNIERAVYAASVR